jgi:TctA family transporter
MLEQNLRRALSISNGNVAILWQSGVTKTLLFLAIAVIVVPRCCGTGGSASLIRRATCPLPDAQRHWRSLSAANDGIR